MVSRLLRPLLSSRLRPVRSGQTSTWPIRPSGSGTGRLARMPGTPTGPRRGGTGATERSITLRKPLRRRHKAVFRPRQEMTASAAGCGSTAETGTGRPMMPGHVQSIRPSESRMPCWLSSGSFRLPPMTPNLICLLKEKRRDPSLRIRLLRHRGRNSRVASIGVEAVVLLRDREVSSGRPSTSLSRGATAWRLHDNPGRTIRTN